jgi:hypothetical protein
MVQKKFQPVLTKESKVKSKGKRFYTTFFEGNGKTYTYDEIRKFAQKKSNELKKMNDERGYFQVTLKFDEKTYRTSGMTKQGHHVKLWSPEDYDIDIEDWGDIIGFQLIYSLEQ